MSSLGIMTLTRGPCELDKMSLFQDLKLKRRKVDSRCSSDGESVADTSTSSPELLCPPSPKMSDVVLNPPSPDSTPTHLVPHLKTVCGESSGVFDGGGVASVIQALPALRSQSPPVRGAATPSPQPPRPHSSPGRPATAPAITAHSPVIRSNPLIVQMPMGEQMHDQSQLHQGVQLTSLTCRGGVIMTQPTHAQNQMWLNQRLNGVKPDIIGIKSTAGGPTHKELITGTAYPSNAPLHATGELVGANASIKPEVIGGNYNHDYHEPKAQPPSSKAPARQTPTVIMGEAGGVRTMIWSQPTATFEAAAPHASSSWSNVEENNAAQMLLNLGQERAQQRHSPPYPLNMERLWAGDLRQLPTNQIQALNLTAPGIAAPPDAKFQAELTSAMELRVDAHDDDDQPMICMICEDKATGLHYGIITCEGCKGFFKRTVQNRRVYTCVADGNCEITKAQRNRCQYCRFKKCIEQGMVLQAVREDRMPGGRNSGAVYNLYKVKYKKHKKPSAQKQSACAQKGAQVVAQTQAQLKSDQNAFKSEAASNIPPNLVNGTILKTALTNPSEVVRLRQRLDSAVSSSRDRTFSIEYSLSMIKTLIDCDEFQDIATLQNLDDLLDHNTDLSEKLCHIGDSIVYKLVQWTKRLPFYLELPVEVHTRLLTHKWHELLVLTTSAYQAIHKPATPQQQAAKVDFAHEVESNLCTLQNCLTSMMGREITIEQLRTDVGLMIEKITHVTLMFRQIKLTMQEYVCLKVITMLNQAKPSSSSGSSELEIIHERYMTCLRVYTQHMYPQQTTRFQDLLVRLPEIQSAASLLLESKMFYVPFLLNSAIQR